MAKTPSLRIVSHSTAFLDKAEVVEVEAERPYVMSGGLFSEAKMPIIEEDAIIDPDIFFTLPDLISLLQEQVVIGNLALMSEKTGLQKEEIISLLNEIRIGDAPKLRKVRMALGVQRARYAPLR